jgi:unsaturated rhamnogalacturonyl hydrolase
MIKQKVTQALIIATILTGCQNPNGAKNNNSNVESEKIEMAIPDTLPWSVRMAESTMKRFPEAWQMEGRTKPKWSYSHGVTLLGFEALWKATGNERYYDYIKGYADTCIREDGSVINYSIEEYNIDRVSNGKFIIDLYERTGQENYKKAFEMFREQMRTHPRIEEGGYWHKERYPWQMWLDGLFMASPFLAEYATKFNEPELFDDIAHQLLLMEKKARDTKTGLLYHAYDEKKQQSWADPATGLSKNFWARAMGWYAMAIVDVLDYLPRDHEKREDIIAVLQRLTEALSKYQDQETGLWYQVVDQGSREGNYFEATAACMFSYSILKAVRLGYLDEKYREIGTIAYNGIIEHLIEVKADGEVVLTQCCSVAGLSDDRPGTFEYYISEPIVENDPKGVGPFILASMEMER